MVIDGLHNEKDGGNGKSSCGQVVGSTVEGMLRVRVNVVASEFPRMVRKARIENVSRDRLFLHLANSRSSSIAYTTWSKSDEELTKDEKLKIQRFERLHQYRKIEDYYVRNVMSEELKALSEKDSYKYIRILKEKVYLWWKLRNEKDADNLNIMLSNIDDKPAQWLKMYGLIGWELFKPFPQGGKLIRIMQSTIFKSFDPFLSKLILQTYSLIINIPWLVGFILFSLGIIKDLKPLWFWFSIGFFSFICAHLLSNNPHSRYMLPLLPVGYIAFFTFFNSNMNFKMKSGQ